MKIQTIFLYILGMPKTILFNLKYFPFKLAIRLPVLVSHRVWLMKLSGKVKISNISTGSIKIGFGEIGIFDQHRSRTIWQVSGIIEFKGRANIGHGSKLSVSGNLIIGKSFIMSAESSIVARECVTIGDNVLVSWDVLIMDTDFHIIYDSKKNQTNYSRPITIGNMVWIGCRSLILKGVNIADGVVVAAASTVNQSIEIPHSIVANTATVIRENITWS